MTGEESTDRPGYIPDGVPEGRCGHTTDYGEDPSRPGNIACYRETWNGYDKCVWHTDVPDKPLGDLVEARADNPERLDGSVLRETTLGNTIDFVDCTLMAANLTNANLQEIDISGADLRDADLEGVNLYKANLNDSVLWSANLTNAFIASANLVDTNLFQANLTNAHLRDVDFTNSHLGSSDVSNAVLRNAVLTGAHLVEADLINTDLRDANLTNANLVGADFTNSDLRDVNLTGTDLRGAKLTETYLGGAELTKVNLSSADLTNADLLGVNLTGVIIEHTTLIGANLTGASLTRVSLKKADFTNATLHGVDFSGITLTQADFTKSDLSEAILRQAYLEDASLENADLDAADLTDARLHNCRLQDVYISEETTFGDRCIYEKEVREAIKTDGLTEDQLEPIEKAISIYRTYQRLLRENSLPGDIPQYFYREKEMRRLKARAEGNHLEWGYRELQKWVMGYGERPWRVVITSLLVVLVFAVLYPLAGGVELETDVAGPEFLTYLYFSGVTFTTLGYGDVHPLTQAAQQLAVVQSFLGAALMALLVAVLTRRAMR